LSEQDVAVIERETVHAGVALARAEQ